MANRLTDTEVTDYLGDVTLPDEGITVVIAAEQAAQEARCTIPTTVPADLDEALKRRVARNLAARGVPVAQFTAFEGGGTVTRLPWEDAEIKRLEAPYRKVKVH